MFRWESKSMPGKRSFHLGIPDRRLSGRGARLRVYHDTSEL
jgi:hypothetical protein